MRCYILGAGPTGLALADGLTQNADIPFVVIERQPTIGGLSQTICWKKHGYHDLGPHKLFTKDKKLMSYILSLLPQNEWLLRPKQSSIYIKGHFLPYPPLPFSLIKVYGLSKFIRMMLDYGKTKIQTIRSAKKAKTFEDDLVNRVGSQIYEAMFKPMALKLWGIPHMLDVKLSQSRIQTPSFSEIIRCLLNVRSSSNFEALNFYYPRGGIQKIWKSIFNKTRLQGIYLLNQKITCMVVKNNRVNTIHYKDCITGNETKIQLDKDDFVFSTIPLLTLSEIMNGEITKALKENIKRIVRLNDLMLVFLKIDKPSLIDESWVFVPDLEIIFHRLSEQESFDPDMTPNGSIVYCEVMSSEARPLNRMSDKDLISLVKKGLHDMGYKGFSVIDQKIIHLPALYPVFQVGFKPVLQEILDELDRLVNFRTIGRQGAFHYISTLDAMDIGYGAARWLVNYKATPDARDSWKEERQRTEYYPVLD